MTRVASFTCLPRNSWMSGLLRPIRRTVRQLADGSYTRSGHGQYVKHPKYARDSIHFIRAFMAIDADVHGMLEFIEPADENLGTYSLKLHGLLMRICIEIEANLRAILEDNLYSPSGQWSMKDYKNVERSHFLSLYQAKMPIWTGQKRTISPFWPWRNDQPLTWYQEYNSAKHDRHGSFKKATFGNVIEAYAALAVVLFAQFRDETFSGPDLLALESTEDTEGFDYGPTPNVLIKPANLPQEERYAFDWQALCEEADPFVQFVYQV
jgi:hypothetical protein